MISQTSFGRSSVFILAMVLNGLGFIDQRLCLYPDFLRNISTERLFRESVTKKDLNQNLRILKIHQKFCEGIISL